MRRIVNWMICGCVGIGLVFSWQQISAQDNPVAGKWTGSIVQRGNSVVSVDMKIAQSGKTLSGTVIVGGRLMGPSWSKEYEAQLTGQIEGRNVTIEWRNPEAHHIMANLTLADNGTSLDGTGYVRATSTTGVFKLRKSD
jgi:hypothetical protein